MGSLRGNDGRGPALYLRQAAQQRRERVTKDWREEVRDILEENQFDSPASGESPRPNPEPDQPRGPWLDAFGGWLRRRFATTNEMLVTAASLVVLGLLLYATPLRPVAAIFALAGGVTFVLAIGRGIIERRSGVGGPPDRPTRRCGEARSSTSTITARRRRSATGFGPGFAAVDRLTQALNAPPANRRPSAPRGVSVQPAWVGWAIPSLESRP